MVSNLIDIDPSDVTIGMAVEVVWEDMGPALALPASAAAAEPSDGRERHP